MMARIRTVAVLPTLFTLANLVCGFFAIVVACGSMRRRRAKFPLPLPWEHAAR